MKKISRDNRAALVCSLISVLAGFFAMAASADGWPDPTALVKIADSDPIASLARQIDPQFALETAVEIYDGVYYYAMA